MKAQERQPLLAWVPGSQGPEERGPRGGELGQPTEREDFVPGMPSTGYGRCGNGEKQVEVRRVGAARKGATRVTKLLVPFPPTDFCSMPILIMQTAQL